MGDVVVDNNEGVVLVVVNLGHVEALVAVVVVSFKLITRDDDGKSVLQSKHTAV